MEVLQQKVYRPVVTVCYKILHPAADAEDGSPPVDERLRFVELRLECGNAYEI